MNYYRPECSSYLPKELKRLGCCVDGARLRVRLRENEFSVTSLALHILVTEEAFYKMGCHGLKTRDGASERGTVQKGGAPEGGASGRGVPQWAVLLGAGVFQKGAPADPWHVVTRRGTG